MEDYWKALLTGLTPEKKENLSLWWKIPSALVLIILSLKIFL